MAIIFNPNDATDVQWYYTNVTDYSRYGVFKALNDMVLAGNPAPLATYIAWLNNQGEAYDADYYDTDNQ